MARTSIEWTECSWNPVTGCTKISAGCEHCYAERMAKRLKAMGLSRYRNGFDVTMHRDLVDLPIRWKKPQSIFVNSMSDLFHEDVPDTFIESVITTIRLAEWHRFQLLTKRAERIEKIEIDFAWPSNTMLGVTVENRNTIGRIDALRASSAPCKFISFEPLIGPVGMINLHGINWVIVGGESGPGARPMDEAWVIEIKRQAEFLEIPFFSSSGTEYLKRRGEESSKDESGTRSQNWSLKKNRIGW
jgi:protein gp37